MDVGELLPVNVDGTTEIFHTVSYPIFIYGKPVSGDYADLLNVREQGELEVARFLARGFKSSIQIISVPVHTLENDYTAIHQVVTLTLPL